jgi:hypothetical protein
MMSGGTKYILMMTFFILQCEKLFLSTASTMRPASAVHYSSPRMAATCARILLTFDLMSSAALLPLLMVPDELPEPD